MTSAQILREARSRAGLTQGQLGRWTNRAASAIGRWERGESEPSFEMLERLVGAVGFEVRTVLIPTDDHDVVLVRRCLNRKAHQRLDDLVRSVRAVSSMARAASG